MKKFLMMITVLLLIASLTACGNSPSSAPTEAVEAGTEPAAAETAAPVTEAAVKSADGVDVDLTAMSGTMVYSEVLNMQQTPEKYLGKTVKMKGPFNVTEIDDNRYFACIIADATACCSTGIEFDWAGDHSYPEDYPDPDAEITVVGTFTTYMEGKSRYLQLQNADVQF